MKPRNFDPSVSILHSNVSMRNCINYSLRAVHCVTVPRDGNYKFNDATKAAIDDCQSV